MNSHKYFCSVLFDYLVVLKRINGKKMIEKKIRSVTFCPPKSMPILFLFIMVFSGNENLQQKKNPMQSFFPKKKTKIVTHICLFENPNLCSVKTKTKNKKNSLCFFHLLIYWPCYLLFIFNLYFCLSVVGLPLMF